jgi:biotin carboxylase
MGCSLLVLMRRGLRPKSADHIQALADLGADLHLVTSTSEGIAQDPRFVSAMAVPPRAGHDELVQRVCAAARDRQATAVVTFSEYDIAVASEANQRLGTGWACPEANRISRDKNRQREFLRSHAIPSVWYCPVSDIGAAMAAGSEHGFPLIVKPTRSASSTRVELVRDPAALKSSLLSIRAIEDASVGDSGMNGVLSSNAGPWALLEEYVPGREVTIDGVVLAGRFVLGGIHDKALSHGPFFEEDLYTLPFSAPGREAELAAIAEGIVKCLRPGLALFNAELREDANGEFRVIEFSTRLSGGHVYRNIRDVYGIDLVRMFARAVLGEPSELILEQDGIRRAPRMATCIKRLYANGLVVRNSVGNAIYSPSFRSYHPMAKPGEIIASAPNGFDCAGSLSVWLPWQPGQAPAAAHEVARAVAADLDLEIEEL